MWQRQRPTLTLAAPTVSFRVCWRASAQNMGQPASGLPASNWLTWQVRPSDTHISRLHLCGRLQHDCMEKLVSGTTAVMRATVKQGILH